MTVTVESHPCLYSALLMMAADAGAVNAIEGTPQQFLIPASVLPLLEAAERGCASLLEDDLGDLAYGEVDDALRIANRNPDLMAAHVILDAVFEEGL